MLVKLSGKTDLADSYTRYKVQVYLFCAFVIIFLPIGWAFFSMKKKTDNEIARVNSSLRVGMSSEQVEELLGVPRKVYDSLDMIPEELSEHFGVVTYKERVWIYNREGIPYWRIILLFDRDCDIMEAFQIIK